MSRSMIAVSRGKYMLARMFISVSPPSTGMQATSVDAGPRFSTGQKWSFGLGSFAQWFVNGAFNTWVFAFYFSAKLLPVAYIGLAYVIWTIWNAVNDPLIGFISDRTRTRFGRRKPYIMAGTIPVVVIEIILWLPPGQAGDPAGYIPNFIYLLVMLLCYDTFYTMIALPYDALFPELYTSVEERAQVNTIKQVLATIGLILAFLVPGLFIDEITNPSGYLVNGLVTSAIVGTTLVVSLRTGVVEREEFKLDHKQEFGFFQSLKYTLKNKGFVLYTIMFFLYEYVLLVLSTTVPLFTKHALGVSSTFMASIMIGLMFIVGIATVVVWRKLDVSIGSKKAYAISIVAYFVASIPLLFIDENNGGYLGGVLAATAMGFGFGGMLYFIYLIIADVIDDDELKTGVRREGAFFGVTNFFMRLAMVLSILTVSLVFATTGWEDYIPLPGVDTILGLRMLVVVFPGIALGLTLACLHFYPFSKERVASIKGRLQQMHDAKRERVRSAGV
ncbi:MAG: MFS transporter [Candidatus Lokiarchaeota archaeon]|nr:MFS transporter [Candidatus Lokiarchaeota archaeon]